jgi:hypothetical protein
MNEISIVRRERLVCLDVELHRHGIEPCRFNSGHAMLRTIRQCVPVALIAASLGLAACKGSDSPDGPVQPPPGQPPVSLAPTAAFTAPATVNATDPVVFDASTSASRDGSALQYVWDFGNGQRGGGRVITRSFGAGGALTVTLTVVDTANRIGTISRSITVTAPPPPAGTVSAQGVVKGLDGVPISGVTVAQVGTSTTAITDTAGKASLSLGTASPLTLRFTKAGLADQVLTLRLPGTSGADAAFEVMMRPRDAALSLADAALGGTLNGRDGAVLTLPANALVNAAGTAVSGQVQVNITPVDVTQPGGGGFPGAFEGLQQNGSATSIVSFGTTEFVLNAGGQRVQVAPGKRATIELPLYAGKRLNGTAIAVGDSIPLWSLDETTGMWVQEGTGVVVASPTSPSALAMRAEVAHFSWWNIDIGFEPYGPQPRCVYDTDIGLPGGNDTFATATICNMLAEIDRGLEGSRQAAASVPNRAAAAETRFPGFAARRAIPISGGVTIPVPAGINVVLTGAALNGTWTGRTVVSGPVGVQAEAIIKMRPIAGGGSTPEAITLPFDGTRALTTQQSTLRFTFPGAASRFARLVVSAGLGSSFSGRARVLQGTTVLDSAIVPAGRSAEVVVGVAAGATYTIEVSGTAPSAFRLQAELVGGVQEEVLSLPADVSRTLAPYITYRGAVTVTAPGAIYLARSMVTNLVNVRLLSPTGAVLLDATSLPDAARGASVALPAAGTYTVEVRSRTATQSSAVRLTVERTQWVRIAPELDQAGVYQIADAKADKNGRIVVGYFEPVGSGARFKLQRWTGTAWEAAAADVSVANPCSGSGAIANFAFDNSNRPVLVLGNRVDAGSATFVTAYRYSGNAWQPLGANGGRMPLGSNFGGACASLPGLAIGSDDAPIVSYGYENSIAVQRYDGSAWKGLVVADTSGDVFPLQGGTHDLQVDVSGRVWFVTGTSSFSGAAARVRRFTPAATKWDSIGSALPQTGTIGLATPRLRFGSDGLPQIAWIAAVGSGGTSAGGVASYRFDGTTWSTTGGYQADSSRMIQGPNDLGFAIAGTESLVSWTNLAQGRSTAVIVQRSTASGWTPIGSGRGEIPQFSTAGATDLTSYSSKLVAVGSDVYLVLIASSPSVWKLSLLRRVAN